MKPLLNSFKQNLTAAGQKLKGAWQLVRQKAAALWRLLRLKTANTAAAAKRTLTNFWQKHHKTLLWLGVWLAFGTLATAGLFYAYRTSPQARHWLSQTATAILALVLAPLHWLARQQTVTDASASPVAAQTMPVAPVIQPIPGLPQPNSGSPQPK